MPLEEDARAEFNASSPVSILTSVTPGMEEEGKIPLGPVSGLIGLPNGSEAAIEDLRHFLAFVLMTFPAANNENGDNIKRC